MVHLQRLHEKYSKDGVFVFAISLHPDAEEARKATKDFGLTYTLFQGNESPLADQYGYG